MLPNDVNENPLTNFSLTILYGTFIIAWDSFRHSFAFALNPAPGIHSGTYLTREMLITIKHR